MAVFKKGDIIRVANTSDIGYNDYNFYMVTKVLKTSYWIKSLKLGKVYKTKDLKFMVEDETVMAFVDRCYRIVPDTEYILYGEKNEKT